MLRTILGFLLANALLVTALLLTQAVSADSVTKTEPSATVGTAR